MKRFFATFSFSLKDGFVIDGENGFVLQPFDEVYVRKSPGYFEQQNVTVEGQVVFGGTYALSKQNERLSDLIAKAGGFTSLAYVEGAKLERRMNESERQRYEEAIRMQRKQEQITLLEMAMKSGRNIADLKAWQDMEQEIDAPEYYPVGINLEKALKNPGSDADIVLREGDRLVVPLFTNTVKISGEVLYENTVGFMKGKKAKYYINQAGGYSNLAKKSRAYIIYQNGDVATVKSGAKIMPGCEIVVPQKSMNKLSTTETMALGTGIVSIGMMVVTLVNALSK